MTFEIYMCSMDTWEIYVQMQVSTDGALCTSRAIMDNIARNNTAENQQVDMFTEQRIQKRSSIV